MLKIHPNRTLNDAHRVIRDYGLDKYPWQGIGTAEGFANRLFVPGRQMTTQELATAFYKYLEDCVERGTVHVDQGWEERANELHTVLDRYNSERLEAAKIIRDLKLKTPGGGLCWQLVAALATTDDRLSLLSGLAVEECEDLRTMLYGIETLEPLFLGWDGHPYRAGGNPFVDNCVRQDIERFDITLESLEPWTGQDEEWFDEASALMRLVICSDVYDELDKLVEAASAQPATSA